MCIFLMAIDTEHLFMCLLVISISSFLVAQLVKSLPPMWETQVRSLGGEDGWRRKWHPTPIFLPGEFHGQKCLVGYSPWCHKKSDTTE